MGGAVEGTSLTGRRLQVALAREQLAEQFERSLRSVLEDVRRAAEEWRQRPEVSAAAGRSRSRRSRGRRRRELTLPQLSCLLSGSGRRADLRICAVSGSGAHKRNMTFADLHSCPPPVHRC